MPMKLDSALNRIENGLSLIAAIPVIGSIAGGTKIILGTGQLITAIGCGSLAGISGFFTKNWKPVKHSWTHIKHGTGNIVAGTIESIPVVQTVLLIVRIAREVKTSDEKVSINTHQKFKFMPYDSQVEKTWKFECVWDSEELKDSIIKEFDQTVKERKPNPKAELKIAKKLVANALKEEN